MTTDRWSFGLQFAAALSCDLVGGVFFAFSNFVMQALARLPAAQGIAAMNSINVTVINPLFMAILFGTGLACLALAGGSLMRWQSAGSAYVLAGSLLYVIGTVLVTMMCNVPLNNALAKVAADSAEGAQLWAHYLTNWVWWNHVRTLASLAAAALLSFALR
jgi:uncharacterized membrane protein